MKRFKAFTLVELVIVMVIMSILMLGIMQLFKPLGDVYSQATTMETQRTAQNGIMRYIAENIRFATHLAVDNNSTSPAVAITQFLNDADDHMEFEEGRTMEVHLIAIDNRTRPEFAINGVPYTGRVRKGIYRYSSTTLTPVSGGGPSSVDDMRIALGPAFYGPATFSIALLPHTDDELRSLDITVSSLNTSNLNRRSNSQTNNLNSHAQGVISTKGEAKLLNMSNRVGEPGMYDVSRFNGSSNTPGGVTYIVYVNKWYTGL
ncbi:MAG: prepilin-type N-terminal cleavage/methylation domain-containing protein [Oscillospiraceae bacterium]|nr:prepilin-type N-terminal cleavage/methylation domain-containing protein [Oscillospiraceae bacterium]